MKKSPFPGMDPFLERHWADVHHRLISYIADTLQPQLAEDLIARVEETVYVEDEDESRLQRPDVRVVEQPIPWRIEQSAVATAVLDEPILLKPILVDPIRQGSVKIYDGAGQHVVTAIELLSPWNKRPGKAVEEYLEKREKYVNSDANLVEIDLVRTGEWTKMLGPYFIPANARTTYRVTVTEPESIGPYLYPIPYNAKLPTINVPLREQDAPAKLNLQELLERAYEMGRYNRIDYSQPCVPPLVGPEKSWADQVLAEAGKREAEGQ